MGDCAARNDATPVARNDNGWRFVEWSPVVLGALAATALSSVLVGFGVTVGLGISSTAPTWRDASAALAILSGVYLILQAIISFGVGGYLAGRVRAVAGARATVVEETERADGVHGLGAWALAVVIGESRYFNRRGYRKPDVFHAERCTSKRGGAAAGYELIGCFVPVAARPT